MIRKCLSVFVLLLILSACIPAPRTPVDSPTPQPTGVEAQDIASQTQNIPQTQDITQAHNYASLPAKTPLATATPSGLQVDIASQELSPLAPISLRFNRPMDPGKKPSMLRHKTDSYIVVSAETHQKRAA